MATELGDPRLRSAALAGMLALVTALSGCSWIGVRPLKRAPRPPAEESCTETYGAPIVDTLAGAAYATLAIASVVVLAQDDDSSEDCTVETADEWCGVDIDLSGLFIGTALIAGAGSITHGASAVYGYDHVSQCRAAR